MGAEEINTCTSLSLPPQISRGAPHPPGPTGSQRVGQESLGDVPQVVRFLRCRAGQSRVQCGSGIGGGPGKDTMVCEMWLEHGVWVRVRSSRGTQSGDVTTKEPTCQAKGEWKPLTCCGQRHGHCWPLPRALGTGVHQMMPGGQ